MGHTISSGPRGLDWRNEVLWFRHDQPVECKVRSDAFDDFYQDFDNIEMKRMEMYRSKWQPLKKSTRIHHVYLLFYGTDDMYYLVEKTQLSVIIQYGPNVDSLHNYNIKTPRGKDAKKIGSCTELIECDLFRIYQILEEEKEHGYSLLNDNCQHFAQRCFNSFAEDLDKINRY